MARSAATKSFTQQSQKRPVLLRYRTLRLVRPTLSQLFPAHFLYSRPTLLEVEFICYTNTPMNVHYGGVRPATVLDKNSIVFIAFSTSLKFSFQMRIPSLVSSTTTCAGLSRDFLLAISTGIFNIADLLFVKKIGTTFFLRSFMHTVL